jgi:Trypsin-co-occurring domain 1
MTEPDYGEGGSSNAQAGATHEILVEVLPKLDRRRQIKWGEPNVVERLEARADDIRNAIEVGTSSVAEGLRELATPEGWGINDVSVSFGIALTAEAGAVITKASVGATLEVAVTFTRERPSVTDTAAGG